MPPAPDITNIPAPRVAFIDPRTGLMAREWYLFFLNLFINSGGASNLNLAALQMAPAPQDAAALLAQASDDAQVPSSNDAALAALAQDVQALSVAPVPQLEVQQLCYGAFHDMTRQTAALTNTAYAVTLNTTSTALGTYIGSPTSRVYVNAPGVYNVQFSAQVDKTSGGAALVYFWPRVNGTDVVDSMSHIRIKDNDSELIAAWNFVLPMQAGGYFELMWATSATDVILETFAATAFGPAAPSVILTVTQVNL